MKNNSEELIRLARQEFGQLTNADRKLFRAVARHEVANFKANVDELNQPESSEQWGAERTLKADRLVWLLTNTEAIQLISFRGLRISGAKIEGELNLEYATIFVPLIFDTCAFTEPLILNKSKLKELQMQGSYVSGIQAAEISLEGSVCLSDGFTAVGEVNLIRASIGGQLDCSGGMFFHELNIILIIWLLFQAIKSMSGPIFYFYVKFLRKLPKTAINANAATITADVFLHNGFKAEGEVNLMGTSIAGLLSCMGGEFSNKGQIAIRAATAKIAANVYLRYGFKAEGEVNIVGASIAGQIDCYGGEFSNEGETAINADTAKIAADVFLCNGFKAVGMVNLRGASIGGQLTCIEGEFRNKGKIAINADAATISADVFLSSKFKAEGEVNLRGASIGGQIDCSGGEFSNQGGIAIQADAAAIAADVFLGDDFKAVGMVNLSRASIGGLLSCIGGDFSNEGKIAINADAAAIAANVFLRDKFKAEGEVNLCGASIGGQLDCSGGEFSNQGETAIQAYAAMIAADVLLCNAFKAVGEVNLRGASIGKRLVCIGGEFSNEGETAIAADAATIAASVFLSDGFRAVGMVDLLRASIGGRLVCIGGQFLNETRSVLDAEGSKIGGSVFLGGKYNNSQFQAKGKLIFLNATIEDQLELELIRDLRLNNFWLLLLKIDCLAGILFLLKPSIKLDLRFAKVNTFSFQNRQAEESWMKQIKQGQLFLNGFVYSSINVTNAAIKDNTLKKWLRLQIKKGSESQSENGFALQPYEQLATVLRANGHQEAATKVLIAKEDDRFKYGGLTRSGKVWNGILGVAIAHGYRPEKALIYSVFVILVGWGVFFLNQGLMAKTKDNPGSSAVFNPLVYSIDTFTPVIDLHQQKMWLPDASKGKERYIFHPSLKRRSGDWLRRYFWFQIIAGWVLTSLWVAGFTGLVRNKN